MRDTGVSTSGIVFDPRAFTTLCFVDLDDAGRPDYMFVRKPGQIRDWRSVNFP